jgi:hypothetical protein
MQRRTGAFEARNLRIVGHDVCPSPGEAARPLHPQVFITGANTTEPLSAMGPLKSLNAVTVAFRAFWSTGETEAGLLDDANLRRAGSRLLPGEQHR